MEYRRKRYIKSVPVGEKLKKLYSNEKRSFNLPIEASIKVTQV
jgi:hypothetical protein